MGGKCFQDFWKKKNILMFLFVLAECMNGQGENDPYEENINYALIDRTKMSNCLAPVTGIPTAYECMQRCNTNIKTCYAVNYDAGNLYCQLCLRQGYQIVPNPQFDFYFKKDCSTISFSSFLKL